MGEGGRRTKEIKKWTQSSEKMGEWGKRDGKGRDIGGQKRNKKLVNFINIFSMAKQV